MATQKLVRSRCLIAVFRMLELRCRGMDLTAKISLVPSKFEALSSQVATIFKGHAPPILYFNNAASGMETLENLHSAVIEVAKITKALFCVADPTKFSKCKTFAEFAAVHISRNMFRYKSNPNMTILTCISTVLKEKAAEFGCFFQTAFIPSQNSYD